MDAKPQRIRVRGDENVPPTFVANKTIHSRNKSTPALGLMAQKTKPHNGPPRQAFGDVSNFKKTSDDMTLVTKPGVRASDDKRALSQPAQRPLSVSGAKGLLQNVGSKPINTAKKATTQGSKNDAKRTNVVFHDQLEPVVETEASKEGHINAQTHHRDEINTDKKTSKVAFEAGEANLDSLEPIAAQPRQLIEAQHSQRIGEKGDGPAVAIDDSKPGFAAHDVPVATEVASVAAYTAYEDVIYRQGPDMTGPTLSDPDYSEDDETHGYHYRSENTTGGITTVIYPHPTAAIEREILRAQSIVEASITDEELEEDFYDGSMVAEYSTEIFEYLRVKEIEMLPAPDYMANQGEIQWSMRAILMDWLVQVHFRFALLPETLFLCVNLVDRFLSKKVVSVGKLQLAGATAIFIAAKYEEITAPTVSEIKFMVDGGYTVDEILKAERFMLNILNYDLGWPGPMSFLRRISKADDYDLETRTVAKYFLELTIMDERFVATPPSFLSAGAHCLSRLMLRKGCWTMAHAHYSGYLYTQLVPVMLTMLECCEDPQRHHQAIYEKYSDRRFKRASTFVESEIRSGFQLPRPTPFNDPKRLDGVANY
ncbi:G2/mitotic-specific cyclin-4 [Penicillium oxalicum]|uniref:G2/mitotic-specific cyclin-4 n=1 Tax=Penicillium oxalicum TaxID=69781 RepID=UPI0020B8DB50|nr:G2/mitotic-specific cyclin-4 [Penicillium oxalicum]KAI2789564.1 G2/mitotic-specific cyclin-4 [Penicillium oxalicum]